MAWHEIAWNWLVQTALGDFLVLTAGCLAVRICRQPVRRLRLIALTLAGCAIVPCLGQVPGVPRWLIHWPAQLRVARYEPRNSPVDATAPKVVEAAPGSPLTSSLAKDSRPVTSLDRTTTAPVGWCIPASIGSLPFRPMIVVAYAITAAGLFIWWLVGQFMLSRLYLAATTAPTTVVKLFREVAGPAGNRVCLLESERIEVPFTFTAWRPVIVLPVAFATRNDAATARFCLAQGQHGEALPRESLVHPRPNRGSFLGLARSARRLQPVRDSGAARA
jgi:hypothetical protein